MVKVGITGGIGSGKSTVAKVFASLGIPVYPADQKAKELIGSDPALQRRIVELLGEQAYDQDGHYNTTYVADQVFANRTLLQQLNAIVHPAVGQDFLLWSSKQNSPYVLKEAAIMRRGGDLDRIITVTSPLALRLRRIQERDGRTKDQVLAIIERQQSEADYVAMADFLIKNDENQFIIPQILDIDRQLRTLNPS